MNAFEKQVDILARLAQLMLDQIDNPYDSITCEYEYMGRYGTVSSSLSVMLDGARTHPDTAPEFATDNLELCMKLRELMKGHTGGNWTSFTLSLDASGGARTRFDYS